MSNCRDAVPAAGWRRLLTATSIALTACIATAVAQDNGTTQGQGAQKGADELLSAVVRLKTTINPEGRTVNGLGQQRSGSGIVIDDNGLILTIGYLMVEAQSAEVTTNAGRTFAA